MLGRRNCQRFLARHFVLPADPAKGHVNPLLAGWTDPATRRKFEVRDSRKADGTEIPDVAHLPVVRLLGKLACRAYTAMPDWPADPEDLGIDTLRAAILGRAEAVKDSLIAHYQPDWVLRQGIRALWLWNRSKWVDQRAITPIRAALAKRGLLTTR